MSICLVDTSVFCEILGVPGRCSEQGDHAAELREKLQGGERLLLPMATILEAGNHIGHVSGGQQRREVAERFVERVQKAIQGESPFTPTPFVDQEVLAAWLDEFPDWAMRGDGKGKGSGLGDLTIKAEWERQCELHPRRRVYVWSKDLHLRAYDRGP